MKKTMWILATLGLFHFSAVAQKGSLKDVNEGETLIIVEGADSPAKISRPFPNNIVTHNTAEWKSEGKVALVPKPAITHGIHSTRSVASAHHTKSSLASNATKVHVHPQVAYHKSRRPIHKNVYPTDISMVRESGYAGYRPKVSSDLPPEIENRPSSQPRIEKRGNVKYLYNSHYNSKNYPGDSNGGWDNGANGRGTNSQDGTIKLNEGK